MRQTPEEKALLDDALTALSGLLPKQLSLKMELSKEGLYLRIGKHTSFRLLVRPGWLSNATELRQPEPGVALVVPYVGEPQGAQLRAQGFCYLDRAGNAWLSDVAHELAILILGRARPQVATQAVSGQLFSKNGLRLLYALLLEPRLVREPYRTIAARAGLPTATVGRALLSLQNQDYLRNEKPRRLQRLSELRQRWIDAYGETLRPKLVAGRYRWLEPERARNGWQQVPLPAGTRWGGEPAAHLLLDGYLLPLDFTLYTTAPRGELMGTMRLVPDPNGRVQVLVPFEEPPTETPYPNCVSPLLAYADLVLSGDPRNQEVAAMLAEQYLK